MDLGGIYVELGKKQIQAEGRAWDTVHKGKAYRKKS